MQQILRLLEARENIYRTSDLGQLTLLGRGGTGTVYGTSVADPDSSDLYGILVYKKYRRANDVEFWSHLSAIIGEHATATYNGTRLRDIAAWPMKIVVGDDGLPTGILMPMVPSDFQETIRLPSGRTSITAREAQHIIYAPDVARQRSVDVPPDNSPLIRIKICERLAFALSVLHQAGIVYGDLSTRNVLYSLSPSIGIYLIDCDQVAIVERDSRRAQLDSPDWDPPEHRASDRRLASQRPFASDLYKLGLFILRCLTPGRYSSVNRDTKHAIGIIDAQGIALLNLALAAEPASRPSAAIWVDYLRSQLG